MALRKFVFQNPTDLHLEEQQSSDEIQLGKLTLSGLSGISLDVGNSSLINLPAPSSAGDAARKSYVDSGDTAARAYADTQDTAVKAYADAGDATVRAYVDTAVQGLDVKQSVLVATTANITLSGTQTIDGVAVVAGNRVLVKNQTSTQDNGIYVAASGAWSRSSDADTIAKLNGGAYTFVELGTAGANNGFVLTSEPVTLGTDPIVWTQFSGAGMLTAGAGLTKTGNRLDVVANADGSIVVNSDDIQIGVLASDAQHGSRGGGSLHALAIAGSTAGFLSGSDKTKLDNTTGTNSGDITLGAIGAVPNANAASLTGQVLTLQPASSSYPGILTIGSQSIAGLKTLTTGLAITGAASTVNLQITPSATGYNAAFQVSDSSSNAFFQIYNPLNSGGDAGASIRWTPFYQSAGNIWASLWQPVFNPTGTTGGPFSTGFKIDAYYGHYSGGTTATFATNSNEFVSGGVVQGSRFTSGNMGQFQGLHGAVYNSNKLGTVTTMDAVYAGGSNSGDGTNAGTVTNFNLFHAKSEQHYPSGTVTNLSGLRVESPWLDYRQGTTTNAYGVYIDAQKVSTVTNGWGVFQVGSTTINQFAGRIDSTIATGGNAYTQLQGARHTFDGTTGAKYISSDGTTLTVTGLNLAASNLSGTNTGDFALAAFGSTPNANGASLVGQTLTLQPADGSNPGNISVSAQTMGAGIKTFSSAINSTVASGSSALRVLQGARINFDGATGAKYLSSDGTSLTATGLNLIGSNLTGSNSGDVTLGTASGLSLSGQALSLALATTSTAGAMSAADKTTIGNQSGTNSGDVSLSTANGLSLSGQALSLALATISTPGAMSAADKTTIGNQSGTNSGDMSLGTFGSTPAANGASLAGQVLTLQPADGSNPGSISTSAQTMGAGTKTFSGTLNSTVASAGNALQMVQGARLTFDGATGAKYLSSNGTNVVVTGLGLSASTFTSTAISGANALVTPTGTYIAMGGCTMLGRATDIQIQGTLTCSNVSTGTNFIQGGSAFATGLTLQSNGANGSTSIGFDIVAATTLNVSGGILARFRNNTTTVLTLNFDGRLQWPTGTAADVVGTATLASGTVTVSTTAVKSTSKIFAFHKGSGTSANFGELSQGTIVASTSFVINSTNASDNDSVNWLIVN